MRISRTSWKTTPITSCWRTTNATESFFDIFRVNVHSPAKTSRSPRIRAHIAGWRVDHAGKLGAALTNDGLCTTLLYRDHEEQPFRPIITTDHRTTVSPVMFTFDNKQLYALSNRSRDTEAQVRNDPARPDEEEVIFDPCEVDLHEFHYSRHRKVLTFAIYENGQPQYKFFDTQMEDMYRRPWPIACKATS